MPTIRLTRVANSPRFAQTVPVTRSTGSFQLGGYVDTTSTFDAWGTLQPATTEDLAQVPEGDRITGAMSFISETRLFKTRTTGAGQPSGLSDTILWDGQVYKVASCDLWGDFGFWKAVLTRQSGA